MAPAVILATLVVLAEAAVAEQEEKQLRGVLAATSGAVQGASTDEGVPLTRFQCSPSTDPKDEWLRLEQRPSSKVNPDQVRICVAGTTKVPMSDMQTPAAMTQRRDGKASPAQCTPWTQVSGKAGSKDEFLNKTSAHLTLGANNADNRRFCIFTVSKKQQRIRVGTAARQVNYLKVSVCKDNSIMGSVFGEATCDTMLEKAKEHRDTLSSEGAEGVEFMLAAAKVVTLKQQCGEGMQSQRWKLQLKTLNALKNKLERSLEEETLGEDDKEHLEEVMDPVTMIRNQAKGEASKQDAKMKALKVKVAVAKAKSARAELTSKNAERKIATAKNTGAHKSLQAKIKAVAGSQFDKDDAVLKTLKAKLVAAKKKTAAAKKEVDTANRLLIESKTLSPALINKIGNMVVEEVSRGLAKEVVCDEDDAEETSSDLGESMDDEGPVQLFGLKMPLETAQGKVSLRMANTVVAQPTPAHVAVTDGQGDPRSQIDLIKKLAKRKCNEAKMNLVNAEAGSAQERTLTSGKELWCAAHHYGLKCKAAAVSDAVDSDPWKITPMTKRCVQFRHAVEFMRHYSEDFLMLTKKKRRDLACAVKKVIVHVEDKGEMEKAMGGFRIADPAADLYREQMQQMLASMVV